MISIDFTQSSEKNSYKLLIGSVLPRPIAFVTSKSIQGVLNGSPFSYFNVVSSEPPLLSISIRKEGVALKDTARNILDLKAFVVHIVSGNYLKEVNQSSAPYPSDVSEITAVGLTPVKSQKIDVEGIKEAKIRFECVLEKAVDLEGSTLIIGRVVVAHFDEKVYENGHINLNALDPISRLAGNTYGRVGEIITMDRPILK